MVWRGLTVLASALSGYAVFLCLSHTEERLIVAAAQIAACVTAFVAGWFAAQPRSQRHG